MINIPTPGVTIEQPLVDTTRAQSLAAAMKSVRGLDPPQTMAEFPSAVLTLFAHQFDERRGHAITEEFCAWVKYTTQNTLKHLFPHSVYNVSVDQKRTHLKVTISLIPTST